MPTLIQLLAGQKPLLVPSIYDGISARIVNQLGFQAAYIGSYGTGASKYGVPDIGYIGAEDMADQVRRLAPVVQVPIVVDGEGGWGNPLHVGRSVALLERAGAAATHIEDHDFGKHLTRGPRCLPVNIAVDKFKAALDARASEDFLVIARTDAAGVEGSEAAVDRLLAYQEVGVDALFAAAELDQAAQERLTREARVPIVMLNFPGCTPERVADLGGSMVI
jgi:2-methylisocitrate lyase-like PEP mutase family enzyme